MKLIVLALIFQFVISCWPKTNINEMKRNDLWLNVKGNYIYCIYIY